MVEANCDIVFSTDNPLVVTLRFPRGWGDSVQMLRQELEQKRVTQAYVKLGKPRKPRTTGEKSQNHALNGIIQQICVETGDNFDDVKEEVKRRAIRRGYPKRIDSFGNVHGISESNASTIECGYLIEEAKMVADFCNVRLKGFEDD